MTKAQKLMNDSPVARWSVLVLIALMMFFGYMFVDVMSPLKSLIESSRGWNSTVFGTYAASEYFLNVFCFFLIFAGIILDKMGVRFTGLLSASLMVIGAFIKYIGISDWFQATEFCAWLNSWWVALPGSAKMASLGFMIFGCGCEMAGTTVSKAIAKWFKGKNMALAMGLQLAIARLGTALALLLSPILVSAKPAGSFYTLMETARPAFAGLLLLLAGTILWGIFVAMDARFDAVTGSTDKKETTEEDKFKFSDIFRVLGNKYFILSALLCVFFYCSIISFKKFATSILIPRFGIPVETASLMVSMIPFFTVIFAPLFGFMVDKIGKGTKWMIAGSVLVLLAHVMIAFAPQGVSAFGYVAIAMLGVGYSLVPAALWPAIPKIVPEKNLGTAYSLIYWIQNMGMLLVPIAVGFIFRNEVTMPGNVVQEQGAALHAEFIFITLSMLAIAVSVIFDRLSAKEN